MTHTYHLAGMTCGSCEAKVKDDLFRIPGVTGVDVSRTGSSVTITMDKHIALQTFQQALDKKFTIKVIGHNERLEQTKSWLGTYKPVLLLFGYIASVALLAGNHAGRIDWMTFMNIFMAGFFLSFSFFKFLDLAGFARSYSMYDIVAKRFKTWGYIYAFIELGLGIAYAIGFQPFLTNLTTFVVMSISLLGVLQSALNKKSIQCACLGVIFNLPMSKVTILEDSLMIIMSAGMIFVLL
jgi:copper chaperone CopZ